jgi:hypothetical protein
MSSRISTWAGTDNFRGGTIGGTLIKNHPQSDSLEPRFFGIFADAIADRSRPFRI